MQHFSCRKCRQTKLIAEFEGAISCLLQAPVSTADVNPAYLHTLPLTIRQRSSWHHWSKPCQMQNPLPHDSFLNVPGLMTSYKCYSASPKHLPVCFYKLWERILVRLNCIVTVTRDLKNRHCLLRIWSCGLSYGLWLGSGRSTGTLFQKILCPLLNMKLFQWYQMPPLFCLLSSFPILKHLRTRYLLCSLVQYRWREDFHPLSLRKLSSDYSSSSGKARPLLSEAAPSSFLTQEMKHSTSSVDACLGCLVPFSCGAFFLGLQCLH